MIIFLLAILATACFIDIRTKIIPDWLSVGGIIIGIIGNFFISKPFDPILGIVIAGGGLYVIGMIGDHSYNMPLFGGGDIKLMAAIGAIAGPSIAMATLAITLLYGIFQGFLFRIYLKKEESMPYSPSIALGTLTSIFIVRYYGI